MKGMIQLNKCNLWKFSYTRVEWVWNRILILCLNFSTYIIVDVLCLSRPFPGKESLFIVIRNSNAWMRPINDLTLRPVPNVVLLLRRRISGCHLVSPKIRLRSQATCVTLAISDDTGAVLGKCELINTLSRFYWCLLKHRFDTFTEICQQFNTCKSRLR